MTAMVLSIQTMAFRLDGDMNERIKKLALESGFQYESFKDIWYLEGLNPSCNEELEEFAKLMIKEFILIIQLGITRDGHNTEKYLRSMKHLKQVKEHFGVEE